MTNVSVMVAIDTLDSMIDQDPDNDEDGHSQAWQSPGPASLNARNMLKIDNRAKITGNIAKQIAARTTGTLNLVNSATGGALMGKAGWGALISGATLGAGPIALLVASAALTAAQSAKHGISAYKTNTHIKNLQKIYADAAAYQCDDQKLEHSHVQNIILPYIIAQKEKKKIRRMGSAVPVIGSAIEQTRAKVKATYKWATGNLGKNRKLHAEQLARHHCNSRCDLTSAIIAELFGLTKEEADAARLCHIQELAAVISIKLKSV